MNIWRELAAFSAYLLAHAGLETAYFFAGIQKYMRMFKRLLRDQRNVPLAPLYAIVGYVIFFIATYVVVIRDAWTRRFSMGITLMRAALFGAAVYAVFNLSNAAVVRGYDMVSVAIDVSYGIVSIVLLALIAFMVGPEWKRN